MEKNINYILLSIADIYIYIYIYIYICYIYLSKFYMLNNNT